MSVLTWDDLGLNPFCIQPQVDRSELQCLASHFSRGVWCLGLSQMSFFCLVLSLCVFFFHPLVKNGYRKGNIDGAMFSSKNRHNTFVNRTLLVPRSPCRGASGSSFLTCLVRTWWKVCVFVWRGRCWKILGRQASAKKTVEHALLLFCFCSSRFLKLYFPLLPLNVSVLLLSCLTLSLPPSSLCLSPSLFSS